MLFKNFSKYFLHDNSTEDTRPRERENLTRSKGRSKEREKSLKEKFFPSEVSADDGKRKSYAEPKAEDVDIKLSEMKGDKHEIISKDLTGLGESIEIGEEKYAQEIPWEKDLHRVKTLQEILDVWKRGREENFGNYKAGIIDKEDYEEEERRLDSKYREEIQNLAEESTEH